jgi:hypothetical protein
MLEERRPSPARLVAFVALLLGVAWGLGALAALPWQASPPDAALLKIAIKRVAPLEEAARPLSTEELAKLPRHMRPAGGTGVPGGRRRDTRLAVALDGRPVLDRTYRPGGWRHDGPTLAYAEQRVPPGRHVLEASLGEAGEAGRGWRLQREVEIRAGQVVRLEFSEDAGLILR